ncbi:hypothetical protein EOPP23_01060 [Endozoicomonas sp. OPT23]|uniref:DUF3392 family protein n=1 Tax=Endozoicomonas sp. OPT23 TaxID=2072845 RepID=UPI00129B818F|nr:DUF3392 family protein [Endozoicomonas sp. OPT23]MRI31581.1 hypothetical protein [Endozoicomonas sp. OPT23]
MDWLSSSIIQLSAFCRDYLGIIAMAFTAVAVVISGRSLAAVAGGWLSRFPTLLRIPARAVLNLGLFGAVFYFVPYWLGSLLGYFNNYTLAPVLLIIIVCIGILSEKFR